jgi:hypothetical protein
LSLHTTDGAWYNQPVLGTSGTPFWNAASYDGPKFNIGYCIYGGGACNEGVAMDPGARYLAKAGNSSATANNVYFTNDGRVSADIKMEISSDTDILGWYSLSNPYDVHWLNTSGQPGFFSFNPQGSFGIAANNADISVHGQTFYSSLVYNNASSHFAFFGNNVAAAPEPGEMGLVGGGLLVAGFFLRKRQAKA